MVLRKNVRLLAGIQEIPNFFLDSMSITGYERDFYHHVSAISGTLLDMAKQMDKQNELLDKIVTRLERIADNQH